MRQKTIHIYRNWLQNIRGSGRLLPDLISGLLIGLTEIVFAVSLGSLIFSGELASYLPFGVGIAIISLAITSITISLTSSVPGIITGLQESPAVIQSIVISGIIASLATYSRDDKLVTVLAVLVLTSLLTGVFFLALGFFRLGGLIRYIPYPVMGGFLAGTGWLLIQASFGVMTDLPLTLSNIRLLFLPNQLLLWLPGISLALIMSFVLKKVNYPILIPGILLGAILLFYLVLFITGTSIDAATHLGFLLGNFSNEATWQALPIRNLLTANWSAILRQGGNIISIFILSVTSLLLNATGLELAIKRDIDINHELMSAGIANILSALGGGMVGFQALSESTLSYRLGARRRFVGLVAGVFSIIILFTSASVLNLFPKLILGGLLLFLGIDFLIEWLICGWSKLSKIDYGIVVLILVVIATTDFLIGLGVGLLSTIILFVINYSRINVIHHTLSGTEMCSNVERREQEWYKLQELGDQIHILELQGYIFFGTAYTLLNHIRERVNQSIRLPLRYLVLDFRRVSGLDSSAVFSFIKIRQLAEAQDMTIVLTNISEKLHQKFDRGGLLGVEINVRRFSDLDRGLEWCEDQLLEISDIPGTQTSKSLGDRLADQGFPPNMISSLTAYLERFCIEGGEYLIRQGDQADDLYFIECGKLSIYLELENDKKVRLQTLSERIVVGELGLYINLPRTASIIAEEACVVYRLSKTALAEIKSKDPHLAANIHEFIACLLARRLADTTRLLAALDR